MDASENLDSLLEGNDNQTPNQSLDDLLNTTEDDAVLRSKPSKKPKRIKSFRKSLKKPDNVVSNATQSPSSNIESDKVDISTGQQEESVNKTEKISEEKEDSASKLGDLLEVNEEQLKDDKLKIEDNIETKDDDKNTDNAALERNENNTDAGPESMNQNDQKAETGLNKKPKEDDFGNSSVNHDSQTNQEEDILDISVENVQDDSLDDLLNPDENVLRPKKSKKPKRIKSFRKSLKGSKEQIKQVETAINSAQESSSNVNSTINENEKIWANKHDSIPEDDVLKDPNSNGTEKKVSVEPAVEHVPHDDITKVEKNLVESSGKDQSINSIERDGSKANNFESKHSIDTTKENQTNVAEDTQLDTKDSISNKELATGDVGHEKKDKELDELFKENEENITEESLDDLLYPSTDEVVMRKKPSVKPKRLKSFRKSVKKPMEPKKELKDVNESMLEKVEGFDKKQNLETEQDLEEKRGTAENTPKQSPNDKENTFQLELPTKEETLQASDDVVETVQVSIEIMNTTTVDNDRKEALSVGNCTKETNSEPKEDQIDEILTGITEQDTVEGLDNLLEPSETGFVTRDKPTKKPKRIKSFRKSKVGLGETDKKRLPSSKDDDTEAIFEKNEATEKTDDLIDTLVKQAEDDPSQTRKENTSNLFADTNDDSHITVNSVSLESRPENDTENISEDNKQSTNDDTLKFTNAGTESLTSPEIFMDDDHDPFASPAQSSEFIKVVSDDVEQTDDSQLTEAAVERDIQAPDDLKVQPMSIVDSKPVEEVEDKTILNLDLNEDVVLTGGNRASLESVHPTPSESSPENCIETQFESDTESISDAATKPEAQKRPKRAKSRKSRKLFVEDYDPFASLLKTDEVNNEGPNDQDDNLDALLNDQQPKDDVPDTDNLSSLRENKKHLTTEYSYSQERNNSSSTNIEDSSFQDDIEFGIVDRNLDRNDEDRPVPITDESSGEKLNDVSENSDEVFSNFTDEGQLIKESEKDIGLVENVKDTKNVIDEESGIFKDIDTNNELGSKTEEAEKAEQEITKDNQEMIGGNSDFHRNSGLSESLGDSPLDKSREADAENSGGDDDDAGADDDVDDFLTVSIVEDMDNTETFPTEDFDDKETSNEVPKSITATKLEEDSPTERRSPTEDLFDDPDTKVKGTPSKQRQGKAKLKKSMERSFEDLLHGLSDESEPELDEMILSDDNDNTNLESILVSPEQTKPIKPDKSKDNFSTPARNASTTDSMDILTSTPNMDMNKDMDRELKVPSVEVKIEAPDDDDDDKEMADKENRFEDNQDDIDFADDNDDDADLDVVMRNQNKNSNEGSNDEDKDIDLSAIANSNHLDVDITKQKSALGKKGSMALRRKQSRKSRRSVMATGEDAIFVDSTVPKSSEMMNGDDHIDHENDNYDMSPPAKKPSPSVMVALPGMSGKAPPQRLSTSTPDDNDEDTPKPVKRISKPPPGAFKLPDVMPRLGSKSSASPIEPPKKETNSESTHTFEKPQLRSAKNTNTQDSSKESEKGFEAPVLRSVQGKSQEKTSVSEERDMTFEKPALRSTPKPRETTPETKMETETGTFTKPALKETPRKTQMDKKTSQDTPSENIISRNLRSTNKPNVGQKPSSEKHTFDKPKLKSAGRTDSQDKMEDQDKNENSYKFEKPVLRSARKESQSNDSSDSVSHTFEKPVLKNTGLRNVDSKKETGNVGMFDKPSLRKTPSPEKEVKPSSEPKGTFDKPSLRKTDVSGNATDSTSKTDYKSSFPEMKLRKASSPQKEVVSDKPSWLKDAADKQSKVLDVLHAKVISKADYKSSLSKMKLRKASSPQKEVVSDKPSWLKDAADKQSKVLDVLHAKENTNSSSHKEVPSWLDKTPKGSRGQPLQDASNNQSDQSSERKSSFTTRSREPSIGSENDPDKRKGSISEPKAPQNNYVPSWMRQGRSPSVGTPGFVSPANSTPNSIGSDKIPQWKKDLAQRRASRKEQSPAIDTPQREVSTEPEWKKNIQLRKTRPGDTPAKDKQTVEPEWKKAAEEKRARLRSD